MNKITKIVIPLMLFCLLTSCGNNLSTSEAINTSSIATSNDGTSTNASNQEIKTWNEIDTYGHDLPNYDFDEVDFWSYITNQTDGETSSPSITRTIRIEGEFAKDDLSKYQQVLLTNGYIDISESYSNDLEYLGHLFYECFFDDAITFFVDISLKNEDGTTITDDTLGKYIDFEVYAEKGSLTYPEKNISLILKEIGLENIDLILPDNVKYYMYYLVEEYVDGHFAPTYLQLFIYCDDFASSSADYLIKLTNADYDINNLIFTAKDNSHQIELSQSNISSNGIDLYYLEISKAK